MSDDTLLRGLAGLIEEEQAELARKERICAGRTTLRDEERGGPLDEALTPLGQAERAGMVDALSAALAREAAAVERSNVVPFRPRRPLWRPAALAASVMLAVGLMLFYRPGGELAGLPEYAFRLEGGLTGMRSDPQAGSVPTFATGSHLTLRLSPFTAVEGEVAARFFLMRSGRAERLRLPAPAVSEEGALLVDADVGTDVVLPPGEATLVAVVGRPDALPEAVEIERRLSTGEVLAAEGWRGFSQPIRVE